MADYSNTIIYKLQHNDKPELLYVGHTTNFRARKSRHKHLATRPDCSIKLYQMINGNGGWDSFSMIQICVFVCETKREAEAEEDRIMQELKASMNNNRSFITAEERSDKLWAYHKANLDTKAKRALDYYYLNKEELLKPFLCECGCSITKHYQAKHIKTKKHLRLLAVVEQ